MFFGKDKSYIESPDGKEKTSIEKEGNLFSLKMWVPPNKEASSAKLVEASFAGRHERCRKAPPIEGTGGVPGGVGRGKPG